MVRRRPRTVANRRHAPFMAHPSRHDGGISRQRHRVRRLRRQRRAAEGSGASAGRPARRDPARGQRRRGDRHAADRPHRAARRAVAAVPAGRPRRSMLALPLPALVDGRPAHPGRCCWRRWWRSACRWARWTCHERPRQRGRDRLARADHVLVPRGLERRRADRLGAGRRVRGRRMERAGRPGGQRLRHRRVGDWRRCCCDAANTGFPARAAIASRCPAARWRRCAPSPPSASRWRGRSPTGSASICAAARRLAAAASAAYSAFAFAMACGRLGGDCVVRRFGPVATQRAGGALATVGMAPCCRCRPAAGGGIAGAGRPRGVQHRAGDVQRRRPPRRGVRHRNERHDRLFRPDGRAAGDRLRGPGDQRARRPGLLLAGAVALLALAPAVRPLPAATPVSPRAGRT